MILIYFRITHDVVFRQKWIKYDVGWEKFFSAKGFKREYLARKFREIMFSTDGE